MVMSMPEIVFQVTGLISLLIIGYYRRQYRQRGGTPSEENVVQWEPGYFKFIRFLMSLFYLFAFIYTLLPLIDLFYEITPYLAIMRLEIPNELRYLGLAGIILSTVFLAWATKTLGPNFSPGLELRENHHLVTTGPYRWIRHPMYVGNATWIISFFLLSTWWIFIGYLVLFVVFIMILRTPREEQMLLQAFGEQYRQYMRQTGRFIPKFGKKANDSH